jgi:ligand-binding sensor domain-containing protein
MTLVLLLLFGWPAFASTIEGSAEMPHYSTHYWLREDGLPQNSVTSVIQTRDGYIWVGLQQNKRSGAEADGVFALFAP